MSSYTKVFTDPYPNGWKNLPSEETPITADALQEHTDAIKNIETYLNTNDIPDNIPTKLSDLTDDATHRVVTDTEKTTWNAKANNTVATSDSVGLVKVDGTSVTVDEDGTLHSSGGSGSSDVSWNQIQTSGTKIATITIDDTPTDVYAPTGGGSASIDYGDEDDFNTWSESAQDGEIFVRTDDNEGGGSGSGGEIYDDTERVIGTWFNKPLYRKVLNYGSLPNNTRKDVSIGVSDIDIITRVSGIAYGTDKDVFHLLPSGYAYGIDIVAIGTTSIRIQTNSDRSSLNGYVIIEYTKVGD